MDTIFNITNGDYLAEQLKETTIAGETIICREALVTGPLQSDNLEDFWKLRSFFISNEYNVNESDYFDKTFPEFEKILNIPDDSEVNLWFEDDLFCQVNMWFCLSLLPKDKDLKIYRVFPKATKENNWKGFSFSDNFELEEIAKSKVLFTEKDVELGISLWKFYQSNDRNQLEQLSKNQSDCFHFLREVIDTYLNIKPEIFIKNLMENETTDFKMIFEKFRDELGIFGFGDLQVKSVYDTILRQKQ